CSEQLDELLVQADDAASVGRLGVAGVGSELPALWTVSGGLPATRPVAFVLVPRALPAPADGERAGVEVDVGPAEAERFALAQTEGERDGPAGAVPPLAGSGEDALDLLDGVRLDLHLGQPRRLRERGRVGQEVAAANRFAERGPDGAVRLLRGAGGAAGTDH